MTRVPNDVETLPKISTGWVGRTNLTDRQMTDDRQTDRQTDRQRDGRQHIANGKVSSRSLKSGETTQKIPYHHEERLRKKQKLGTKFPNYRKWKCSYVSSDISWKKVEWKRIPSSCFSWVSYNLQICSGFLKMWAAKHSIIGFLWLDAGCSPKWNAWFDQSVCIGSAKIFFVDRFGILCTARNLWRGTLRIPVI